MSKRRSVSELICEALVSMGLKRVKSHEMQNMVVQYIERHYYTVTPETVQRKWRGLIKQGIVEVDIQRSGVQNVYILKKVGDVVVHQPSEPQLF